MLVKTLSQAKNGLEASTREARMARFVAAERGRAIRLAWRLCHDQSAAEDLTQEAFVTLFQALDQLEDAGLAPWFYKVLVRKSHNLRRWRTVRSKWLPFLGAAAEAREGAAPVTGDPALRKRILDAIDELSSRQREVFVLVHLETFTVDETARILGRSPGTIKTHLHRALASLRSKLTGLLDESPTRDSHEQ